MLVFILMGLMYSHKLVIEIRSALRSSFWSIDENATFDSIGGEAKNTDAGSEDKKDDTETSAKSCENSAVFSSLPSAIKWLRDSVQQNQSVRTQVILMFL